MCKTFSGLAFEISARYRPQQTPFLQLNSRHRGGCLHCRPSNKMSTKLVLWSQCSRTCRFSWRETHAGQRREWNLNVSQFPPVVHKQSFSRCTALNLLTDNRLKCRCSIRGVAAQFNRMRSKRKEHDEDCLKECLGGNVSQKPNSPQQKHQFYVKVYHPNFIPDVSGPGSRLPLTLQKYLLKKIWDSVAFTQLIFHSSCCVQLYLHRNSD